MTGKEKLYFLLERIQDARAIVPSGQPLLLHPADDLNNNYSGIDLDQLFTKLEKDEKILRVLQTPNRVRNAILEEHGRYRDMDDGRYHIKLLPAFDDYYLEIQSEPEYQEFTGEKPQPQKTNEVPSPENQPASGKVHILSANIVAYDLKAKYAETQNEKSDSTFYLKVASYGKYLNDSEALHPILNQLYEESQYQMTPLKVSWTKFYKTWKEYASDLIEVADANEIKDEGPFQNEIEEVRNFINQPNPQFSGDDIPRYYQSYQEVVRRFDTLGKKNLISSKHLDQNGNIKLFSFYAQTETEWNKYKRVREISNWWAHYQVSRLAYGILGNEEERGHYFKDDNNVEDMYRFEFEEIGRNLSYSPIFVRRKKIEGWLTRLHSHVMPRLTALHSDQADIERKNMPGLLKTAAYKLTFYPDDGTAEYRGERNYFTGKARALLFFLNKSKNTPWSLEEIKEKCNPGIVHVARYFKKDKDTRDTVNYIRKRLKVNTGEYFPIQKKNNDWIWIEK